MSEEAPHWLVQSFIDLITKPVEKNQSRGEELITLKDYLQSGKLEKKIDTILADREKQRKEREMEKVREAERLAAAEAKKIADTAKIEEMFEKLPFRPPSISPEVSGDTSETDDKTTDSHVQVLFNPSSNEPRTDFLSFIDNSDAFLMVEKQDFTLANELEQEQLGYPLGVAYDEKLKDWFVCDQANNKIIRINMVHGEVSVTASDMIKNPSAIVMYEEGKSAAILCSESRKNNFTIFLYNLAKPFIRILASHRDETYDMRHALRGLAKSFDKNLVTIEFHSGGSKRVKVIKKDVGSQGFAIRGAINPSFVATFRNTVAVSDLGVNKVFICQLDDRDWNNVHFSQTKVIESKPMAMDRLANESGFAYVSGMQFDVNGFLMIGDAKGHTIKLYDTEYAFLHRVSSDFAMPFMSSFHVNTQGEVMILDVHAARKLHWAHLKSIKEILPWMRGQSDGGYNGQRRSNFQHKPRGGPPHRNWQ